MAAPALRRRAHLDTFDTCVLLLLAAMSCWLVIVLVWHVTGRDLVWLGTDGLGPLDTAQYLAWIRESSEHVLIANPFVLESTSAVFLHPGLLLSGAVTAIGVDPAISYLLWKPVAVVVMFVAARAFVRRTINDAWPRRAALVLALFYEGPAAMVTAVVVGVSAADQLLVDGITNEVWTVWALWGLPFTAIAIALIPLALLAYERARSGSGSHGWPAVLALLCSWLQPWQGATLLAILVATELLRRGDGERSMRLLVTTVVAGAAPLAYYFVLGRVDDAWRLAGEVNLGDGFPTWIFAAALAPIGVPALLGYLVRPSGFQDVAVRVWPVAAIGQYCVLQIGQVGTFPLHAIEGLALPLGILAVIGVRHALRDVSAKRPRVVLAIGTMLIVLLLVPSTIWRLGDDRDHVLSGETPSPFFLRPGEQDALDWLRRQPGDGGVLSEIYLGVLVPGRTGRNTWVGAVSWTPDFFKRVAAAGRIFSGTAEHDEALEVVRRSGARYLLADCRGRTDIGPTLLPVLDEVRTFGCATVYVVRTT